MNPFKRLLQALTVSSWDDPQMNEMKQLQRGSLVILGISLVLQAFVFWETWSQRSWVSWLWAAGLSVEVLVWIVAVRKRWPQLYQLGSVALTLRALAEAGDVQRAPLALEQPVPLSSDEHPPGPTQFGPLRRQRVLLLGEVLVGVLLICLPPGFFVFFLISMSSVIFDEQITWLTVILALVIACMMLPLAYGGIQAIQMARRQALAAYVLADDQGLHWQRPHYSGRSQLYAMEWAQARSFFTLTTGELGTSNWLIGYALDAHTTLLVWWVSQQSSTRERAASDQLCRLIVARTRLSLRDLSSAAQYLVNERLARSGTF